MAIQARSGIQSVFLAHDKRLTLFWRILLYLCGVFVLLVASPILAKLILLGWSSSLPLVVFGLLLSGLYMLINVLGVLGWTYLFRRHVDKRPWRGIGLTSLRQGLPLVLLGFVLGGGMLGLIFGIDYGFGWIQVVGTEFSVSGMVASIGIVIANLMGGSIVPGFTEELAFRGYSFQNLGERFPIWLATLITGVLFGLFHVLHFGEGSVFAIVSFVVLTIPLFTILTVILRLGMRSLWLAIGFHTSWDWFLNNVLGLGSVDSPTYGHALLHIRTTGPDVMVGATPFPTESGLVALFVLVLGIVLFSLWAQYRKWNFSWQARLTDEGQIQIQTPQNI